MKLALQRQRNLAALHALKKAEFAATLLEWDAAQVGWVHGDDLAAEGLAVQPRRRLWDTR